MAEMDGWFTEMVWTMKMHMFCRKSVYVTLALDIIGNSALGLKIEAGNHACRHNQRQHIYTLYEMNACTATPIPRQP